MARWNDELRELGYRDPAEAVPLDGDAAGVDRPRRGSRAGRLRSSGRSGRPGTPPTSAAKSEVLLAQTGLVADPAARSSWPRTSPPAPPTRCVPLLDRTDVPEHVRSLTSPAGARGRGRPRRPARAPRGAAGPHGSRIGGRGLVRIDPTQAAVVGALAGDGPLVVVEGAAGAGKTTALRSTQELLAQQGHRLVVVTPTLKAAEVAAAETGADGHSAAWLIHQHGWRWDDDGHWTRQPDPTPDPERAAAAR